MTEVTPRVATFDCYGTLVDWEGGAAGFLYALALEFGDPVANGDALRVEWDAIEFELIQGPYRPYKEVLAESLRRWMARRGYPWSPERGEAFVRSMRSWQPFPDTIPALRQVKAAGLRLVILSNTDDDIIAHTLRHLEVPFDAVVTAEQVGSYKPSPANFERLRETIAVPPEQTLHVAASLKHDILPASALGMRSAWINRHAEPTPPVAAPTHVWRDLWGLAEHVGGAAPRFCGSPHQLRRGGEASPVTQSARQATTRLRSPSWRGTGC